MSLLGAIPGLRRWIWRRKWTSLDVPAGEWAKLDGMVEELHDLLTNVRSLEKLILDASTLRAGHGMSVKNVWSDPKGKQHGVNIVLDGTTATEKLMEGYHREMDTRRREMMKLTVEMSNWAADNTAPIACENRLPLRVRIADDIREAARIASELNRARKGRTSSEFLRYALLDEKARAKRLCIGTPPECVKLDKPEPPAPPEKKPEKKTGSEARKNAELLPKAFAEQGVDVRFMSFKAAHAVTRYSLRLEEGQKLSKVENAATEIAMRLGVEKVAISKAPDKPQIIFVDVPRKSPEPLLFKDAPECPGKFFVGVGIDREPVFSEMEELPHILIAGTTGSGKSTFLNALICSLIQGPAVKNRFIMIDPKMVELTPYDGIPHLERPVVTDAKEAVAALNSAAAEMDERYRLFKEIGVKDLSDYNQKAPTTMPRLIIVIDELADLMMVSNKEIEASVVRIAQKGRAAGVHLVIATQSPRKDVITGLMKANIPSRISFAVASELESRIILGEKGAENLCGKGDMLFKLNGGQTRRLQGAYISGKEIVRIVKGVING